MKEISKFHQVSFLLWLQLLEKLVQQAHFHQLPEWLCFPPFQTEVKGQQKDTEFATPSSFNGEVESILEKKIY